MKICNLRSFWDFILHGVQINGLDLWTHKYEEQRNATCCLFVAELAFCFCARVVYYET